MADKFECKDCGRMFDSKDSLDQHTQAKHIQAVTQQHKSFRISKKWLIVFIIVAFVGMLIALFLIFYKPSPNSTLIGSPISPDIYTQISGVSFDTLNKVGRGPATGLTSISGSPLTDGGKPLVVYVGAEYCPYCAAERWSMVVALSKFGNFTGLTYMLSSPTDVYANTPTLSFDKASYSSNYISFQSVEMQDRFGHFLHTPTAQQNQLMQSYDTGGGIPFVDIGNQYTLVGAQFQPSSLTGLNWTQISSQLNDPNSPVAQNVDSAANILISAICKTTNSQPLNVCNQTSG